MIQVGSLLRTKKIWVMFWGKECQSRGLDPAAAPPALYYCMVTTVQAVSILLSPMMFLHTVNLSPHQQP